MKGWRSGIEIASSSRVIPIKVKNLRHLLLNLHQRWKFVRIGEATLR